MPIQRISSSVGSYSFQEATLYVKATVKRNLELPRITSRHLHEWVQRGLVEGTERNQKPSEFINFLELVSLRLIAMLRVHGITNKVVRAAHDRLQDKLDWSYPFAMQPLWVARPDIFVELEDSPVAVSRPFQAAFRFMWDYLEPVGKDRHGLTFDESHEATSWEPSDDIVLNPDIQFGEPCIKGTRIPTETLWALNQGGDSVETLAWMYDMPRSRIDAAIAWEKRVAHAAETEQFADVLP